jgi:hypothetical protein
MNMLRHQHIARDYKLKAPPYHLQFTFEDAAGCGLAQQRQSSVTTEGQEVEGSGLLITNKPLRHPNILHPRSQNRSETWGTHAFGEGQT